MNFATTKNIRILIIFNILTFLNIFRQTEGLTCYQCYSIQDCDHPFCQVSANLIFSSFNLQNLTECANFSALIEPRYSQECSSKSDVCGHYRFNMRTSIIKYGLEQPIFINSASNNSNNNGSSSNFTMNQNQTSFPIPFIISPPKAYDSYVHIYGCIPQLVKQRKSSCPLFSKPIAHSVFVNNATTTTTTPVNNTLFSASSSLSPSNISIENVLTISSSVSTCCSCNLNYCNKHESVMNNHEVCHSIFHLGQEEEVPDDYNNGDDSRPIIPTVPGSTNITSPTNATVFPIIIGVVATPKPNNNTVTNPNTTLVDSKPKPGAGDKIKYTSWLLLFTLMLSVN